MLWAEDFLFNIQQAERPLEHYVEEFLSVVHLVSWSDATINTCFQMGLNDDRLFCSITPDDCRKPVAEIINYVLALCNSNYYVDVEDSTLPPICKHAAAPAHHQPESSTCCSNELAPSGPPSLNPVLHSSSLILSPEPAASSRTPAAVAASSRAPATPPCSGLSDASMVSQINVKDNKDVCGFFSPVSPLVLSSYLSSRLVPSSSPKSPLVSSIPPELPPEPELPPKRPPEPELPPVRPPEPELPPARPPEPELPPARPPEPELPPECPPEPELPPERPPEPELPAERPPEPELPPERPPEPELPPESPPERPPEPALPPERPPEPALPPERPPEPGLPVLSWAGNALSSPKKILGGGGIHHGHLNCGFGHGFLNPLFLLGHMDCVLGHGSPNSLTRHGHIDSVLGR
ncbi:hypothetical protein M9458_021220, partial [Cirrhinus mrigala]